MHFTPNAPVKTRRTPGGKLAELRENLMKTLGVYPHGLKKLIDKFVAATYGAPKLKTHYLRVNTYNEMAASEMTIRVFFKFLYILTPRQVTLRVIVTDVGIGKCKGRSAMAEKVLTFVDAEGRSLPYDADAEAADLAKGEETETKRKRTRIKPSPDDELSPGATLSRLRSEIMDKLGMNSLELKSCIERYVTTRHIATDPKALHYVHIATYNEVMAPEMSVKVLFKFLHILASNKVVLEVDFISMRGTFYQTSVDAQYFQPADNVEDATVTHKDIQHGNHSTRSS